MQLLNRASSKSRLLQSHLLFVIWLFVFSGIGGFLPLHAYSLDYTLISSSSVKIAAIILFILGILIGIAIWRIQRKIKKISEPVTALHNESMKQNPLSSLLCLLFGGDPPKYKQGLLYWALVGIYGIGFGISGSYVLFLSLTQPYIVSAEIREVASISAMFGFIFCFGCWLLVLAKKE